MRAAFAGAERDVFTPAVEDYCETVERHGGHRERRTGTVLGSPVLGEWVADPAAWPGNGLSHTMDVQYREDDGRLRWRHVPTVVGIPGQATLNMVHTLQQNFSVDVSIGLLRDRIGHHPWILAAALP